MSQTTISPHNQRPYVTRQLTTEVDVIVSKARAAQKSWRKMQIEQRIGIGLRFVASRAGSFLNVIELGLTFD
jgi:acyl-CoA reductase-like NAD-dependent aldehyde dehydrogenase